MLKIKEIILVVFIGMLFSISYSTNKAMWVWNVKDGTDSTKRIEMLDFCKAQNINRIYLQLDSEFVFAKDSTVTCIIRDMNKMRDFLRAAHSQGIKVDAMDGAPKFALTAHHPEVLSQVDAILAFNKQGKAEEWFDGIHYDIEPYSLQEFKDGKHESIHIQFLNLLTGIMAKIKLSKQDVYLGLAIPFWYDEAEENGKLQYEVTWNKVKKPMSYHLLDVVDEIAIMDYRTQAQGENGTIAHAQGEIKYADSINKKVWVGLETSEVHGDPPTISFFGHPESDLTTVIKETSFAFQKNRSFQGVSIHFYEPYKSMVKKSK